MLLNRLLLLLLRLDDACGAKLLGRILSGVHISPPETKILLPRNRRDIERCKDVYPHHARHIGGHPESSEDIVTPRVVRLQYQTRQPTQLPRTLRQRNLRSIPGDPVSSAIVTLRKSALVTEDRTDAVTEDPLLRLDILLIGISVKPETLIDRILPLRHVLEEILTLITTHRSPYSGP